MIKKLTLTSMLVVFYLCIFAIGNKQNALTYLKKNQINLKLTERDIADLVIMEDAFDENSNINRVWMQQSYNGILLKNGLVSVHFKDGKVINSTNSGVYDLQKNVNTTTPVLSAKDAVIRAASHLGITNVGTINQQGRVINSEYVFEPVEGLSNIEIHAKLAYVKDIKDKVFLSWVVQFHTLDEQHFWNIDINAIDGSMISKYDQILHCNFGTGKYLESQGTHNHNYESMASYIGTPTVPQGANEDVSQPNAGSYRVYPYYIESPVFGTRQLIANPDDATASPYGWHDTNGAAGAEYTITRGNNVYAYTDKDANNSADPNSSPDGGASLVFDFPLDFNTQLDTLVNSKAIVTQLFYMNNIMHDIFFKYGFTESSRNFQAKNYTGATGGNDFVWAEAHDGSGTSNANFATSPDGQNSAFSRTRMQMFMWDGSPPVTLTYNAPASIAGVIDSIGVQSGWGPCNFNVTGPVVNATSSTSPPNFVCGTVNNSPDVSGKIALIDRGNCDFSAKVFNAQQAGAIGVIIINRQSAGDSLLNMSGGTNAGLVTIPAVIVKYSDGQKLRNNLSTANVTLFRQSSTNCLELDGSLDNGIVAHEYGHGISTRLTGFSTGTGGTSICLSNAEQAGEGWSDFFTLVLSKKPADNKNTPRGIGNYAAGQTSSGGGIRRYPFSYDMSINPLTYGDLADDPEVHAIGEIWTAAVWDMYWLLVEKYGYNNDLYNGTGGNNRAIKLVMEGLKLQPCSPGFLDSRNAILKADSILYGYADRCEIWTAFARRGMGFSASQGSSAVATDQIEAFNLHPLCNTTPMPTASFTASDTVLCAGGSLTFTSTSTASSGSLDSIRWTVSGGTPSTGTSTAITSVFSTAGTYTITLMAYKSGNTSTATKTVRVKAIPTVTVTSPTICSGNTATLAASGATSYTWNPNIGSTASVTTPALTTTTTYTVTGTTEGCSRTAVSTVTVNPSPTTAVSTPSAICSGNTVSLTATGATNYTWSPNIGSTATVTTPALTTTTTYTVTGTTGTCSKTATVTVTVNPSPTTAVSTPSAICSGNTASLTATGATSYTWSGGLGSTASVTTPALTTTTTYTVTGTIGSCTSTATVTVTVNPSPTTAVSTPSAICSGNTVSLTATGATSYTWSPNIGSTATVTTPALTTTTTYTVTGTIGSCSKTATVTVTVNPSPTTAVNSTTVCSGSTATLTATGATSYTWSGGLGSTATVTTPTLTTTTSYTVTGTIGSCTKTAVATVTVTSSAPTVTITPNPANVCNGESITLTANGANSYTWTSSQTGTTTGNTLTFTPTGTLTVNLSGTLTGCGTAGTTSTSVTVNPKPTVGVNSTSICSGQTATLTASGATSYTWSPNIGTGETVTTPALTTTTSYTVTGTTGGCTNTAVSTVSVTTSPSVNISVVPASGSICAGQTATLTATGATSYTWNPNIGSTASVTTPSLTTTTAYTVTGSNGNCTSTAATTVTVNSVATPTITQNNLSDTLRSSTVVAGASYEWYRGGVLESTTNVPYYVIPSSGVYTVKVVGNPCSSAMSATYNAVYTAIRTNSNAIQLFELYPNPTNGRLVFNLNLTKQSKVQLQIYTLEGREMYSNQYGTTTQAFEEINMRDYAKGVYIVKLQVGAENFYHKVVKE